ncbi:unnamed protein product [Brachionus calyciflorus]|uniref:G-protein coupled receptors family 3 profile domain-containing protein n=1 Tax=Brachionus calyciflorus TaxID=104777 RepID=A0A813P8F2_9BILA|nr:unnamed protein product [Brachionus calyciflorus]
MILKFNNQIYHKHYKANNGFNYLIILFFGIVQFAKCLGFFEEDYEEKIFRTRDIKCLNNICEDGIFKWHETKTKNLYVGGIFPMVGSWPGGQSCLPSAIMALNEINLNRSILPNYRLNLNWFNSECNPGKGISNLYEMLFHKDKSQDDIIMLLGPGCSDVSSSVAEVANYWNLTVISFGSSSPALSNRNRFKTFFRTHPSAILDNPARLSLCKQFNWKKIVTLQDNKEVFTSTVDDLEKEAKNFEIEILDRQTFTNDPTYAVKNLKKLDARIIVGVFYEQEARKVFCAAYKERMLFPKYIWMIIGWYSENWYLEKDDEISCNRTEMQIAVYGHLTTEVQFFSTHVNEKLDYGLSVQDYNGFFRKFVSSPEWKNYANSFQKIDYKFKQSSLNEDYKSLLEIYDKIDSENSKEIEKLGGYLERSLAFDAVWVMAYALNNTLNHFGSLDYFDIKNYDVSNFIKESMKLINFKGISGMVTFNDQGDRISEVLYEQLQNNSGSLAYVKLGHHFKKTFKCCKNITWGSNKNPPIDGVQRKIRVNKIRMFYSITFSILSTVTILVGVSCLIFNHKFINRKIVKNSEPAINSLLVYGCFLCLISVYIFGFDKSELPAWLFNLICKAEVSLLLLGFTIGYSSLFSKIWYVYSATIQKKKNRKIYPDKIKLYTVIFIMVMIDVIFLFIWFIKDPLQKFTQKLEPENGETEEIIYEPEIRTCKCRHEIIWIGICFGIKGVFLVLGLYLSYETRNSKIEVMNDSRFAALSIYNIVVLSLITAPVVIIIQNQLDAAFCFLSFSINFCSFWTFALMFVPKVKHVLKHTIEQDIQEANLIENMIKEKKEKYLNLSQTNQNLNDEIEKKKEFLIKIEKLLNPNLFDDVGENEHYADDFEDEDFEHEEEDESSSITIENKSNSFGRLSFRNYSTKKEFSNIQNETVI